MFEQPPQVPAADTEFSRKTLNAALLQRPIGYQAQTATNGRRCAAPRRTARGGFRSASKARSISCLAGSRSGIEQADIFPLR
jgi:hypothetical protein